MALGREIARQTGFRLAERKREREREREREKTRFPIVYTTVTPATQPPPSACVTRGGLKSAVKCVDESKIGGSLAANYGKVFFPRRGA